MGEGPLPKAACPFLPGLSGPGWVEEKWVSSVAMATAAAPSQPSHLLATDLTMTSFVRPVGMGARGVRLGARVCVIVMETSDHGGVWVAHLCEAKPGGGGGVCTENVCDVCHICVCV